MHVIALMELSELSRQGLIQGKSLQISCASNVGHDQEQRQRFYLP